MTWSQQAYQERIDEVDAAVNAGRMSPAEGLREFQRAAERLGEAARKAADTISERLLRGDKGRRVDPRPEWPPQVGWHDPYLTIDVRGRLRQRKPLRSPFKKGLISPHHPKDTGIPVDLELAAQAREKEEAARKQAHKAGRYAQRRDRAEAKRRKRDRKKNRGR